MRIDLAAGPGRRQQDAAGLAVLFQPRRHVHFAADDCVIHALGVELFGRDYAVPFGAAPVGFLNMTW